MAGLITREERNLLQRVRRTLAEEIVREEANTGQAPAARARRDRLMRDARDLELLCRRLESQQLALIGTQTPFKEE